MKNLSLIILGLLLVCPILISCNDDDASSKKAVKSLVEDVATKAPAAESAGHFVNFIKTLKQAEGLDSKKQCEAARKIYCELFRAVRENDGSGQLCKIIETELYGGSFPPFGMRACMTMANDKITELQGKEVQLKKICDELRAMRCN